MNWPCHFIYEILTEVFSLVEQPVWLAGLGASLAINSYRSLKFLNLTIGVERDDDEYCDLLCGLTRELRLIIGNNILEELKLYVEISNDTSFQTESEVWSAFDSVLTKSGAFPMLHRVSVVIRWYLESIILLERLKADKFPGLVESKAVEFNIGWNWPVTRTPPLGPGGLNARDQIRSDLFTYDSRT